MIGQKHINPWQGAEDQYQKHQYRNDTRLIQKTDAKPVMAPELLEFHKKKIENNTNASAYDQIASFAAFFDDLSDALFPTSSNVKKVERELELEIEHNQAKMVVPILQEPVVIISVTPKHDSMMEAVQQLSVTDDQKQEYVININESKCPNMQDQKIDEMSDLEHRKINKEEAIPESTPHQVKFQELEQQKINKDKQDATSEPMSHQTKSKSQDIMPFRTSNISKLIPQKTIQDNNNKKKIKHKHIPKDPSVANNQNHQSCDDDNKGPQDSPGNDHANNTGVNNESNGTPVVAPPISSNSIHSPSTVYYHDEEYHEVKKVRPEHRELDKAFVDGTRAISLVEDGLRTKIAVVDGEGKIKQDFNLDLTNQEAKHEVQQCLMEELATKYVFGYKIRQTLNLLGLSPGVAYDIQCFGSCDVNFDPGPGEFNHIIQALLVMAYTKVRIVHQFDYKIPSGTFRKFGRFRLPRKPRNRHINPMETARVMRMALQIINDNGTNDDGINDNQQKQKSTASDQGGIGAPDP